MKTFTTADACEEAEKRLKPLLKEQGIKRGSTKGENMFCTMLDEVEQEWTEQGMVNEFDLP